MGAAGAERARSGHPRLPQLGLLHQTPKALRDALGDAVYLAGWEAGQALGTDKAVAEARHVLYVATSLDTARANTGGSSASGG
jgi:hypothetical protein